MGSMMHSTESYRAMLAILQHVRHKGHGQPSPAHQVKWGLATGVGAGSREGRGLRAAVREGKGIIVALRERTGFGGQC